MSKRRSAAAFALVGLVFGLAAVADATMVRSASLDEMIDASAAIVVGRVLGLRPYRLDDGRIMTAVRVRVEESLHGPFAAGETIQVTTHGGSYGGRHAVVPGAARYARGERVLLELEVIDGRLHTLGLALGKWSVIEDEFGERLLTRSLAGLGIAGASSLTEGPLALATYRDRVRRRRGGAVR